MGAVGWDKPTGQRPDRKCQQVPVSGDPTTPALSPMSDTSKTEARRQRKLAGQGKDRKKKLEKHGTTPKFPIHPDKAPKA